LSQTSVVPQAVQTRAEPQTTVLLVGVGLTSFAALLLELGLTRLFSVVLFYHYAFLAISVALLGLGTGGVFAYLRRESLMRWETRRLASAVSLSCAVLVLLVLEIILHSRVNLHVTLGNFGRLSVVYFAAAGPFFLVGLLFSVVFARNPDTISRLYGADLLGGALACLATVPLLNYIGGPNTVLFAGVVIAVAAVVWSNGSRARFAGATAAVLLILLIAGNRSGRLMDVIYAKGYKRPGVEYTRWNAISRIEVDHHDDGSKWIVIDADASTAIMNVDPRNWGEGGWQKPLMSGAPSIANVLRPNGNFAIIGPGGGVDVLRAVANGSHKVTGIEINPIIANDIMRGRYADFAFHLYQRPDVEIHVSDGRSFIRNTHEQYDVVQMTLVDTWASTAAGAFALSENTLYTVEAFKEYFAHLKPDGMIAITRWEFREPREALRVVSVAMQALHELGVSDTRTNFIVVSDGLLNTDGRPVAVLAKRTGFTAEEERRVVEHLQRNLGLRLLFRPSDPGDNAFSQIVASNNPAAFARQYTFNVAPVTDNSPFFFFPLRFGQIFWKSMHHQMDWKINVGVAVLAIVLLLSIVAVAAFLILPMLLRAGRTQHFLPLIYFVGVGLGYILVEIALIQRFVLFLGHPTYALTVVVFLMLLASGIGSLLSRRWLKDLHWVAGLLTIVALAIAAYVFFLPKLLLALVGVSFPGKLLISGVLLVPLGLIMGMPFPAGLRALSSKAPENAETGNSIEWAWAVNAAASVLGSVLAIVIALEFGLNVTLICGAVAYVVALLFTGTLLRQTA
jgi:hypothetical protein